MGIYLTEDRALRILFRKFNRSLTTKQLDEVKAVLKDSIPRVLPTRTKNLVAVNNGIFDYDTKQLLDFSPDYIFTTKSSVNYNPNAKNVIIHNPKDNTDWDVESWMNELSDDPEVVNVLWEMIGAVIRPNVAWNISAWLFSEKGNNGKGTFCELVRQIIGEGNYASISLADFSKDFMLEPLTHSSAIIVDENDVGTYIDRAANLKAVITGDTIQINRKFKQPIAYQFKLPRMIHAFQINSQGITSDNWNLKFPTLSDISIYISRSIDEQGKIASLLESLDHLITLHQSKSFGHILEAIVSCTLSWEQRKFGELFLEKRDKTEIEDEDILLSCAITGIYLNSELFSHFRGTSNIGYLKIKKNDLILSAQNLHLGNANVNLLFEHGIISPAYKVYELNKCDQYFVQSWVKKDSTKDFFLNATTEGASQCRKNIDWCILNNQLIAIPSLYEQISIGKLFHCLNHLITLHQSKLEKLQKIKKSMLESMFV